MTFPIAKRYVFDCQTQTLSIDYAEFCHPMAFKNVTFLQPKTVFMLLFLIPPKMDYTSQVSLQCEKTFMYNIWLI